MRGGTEKKEQLGEAIERRFSIERPNDLYYANNYIKTGAKVREVKDGD